MKRFLSLFTLVLVLSQVPIFAQKKGNTATSAALSYDSTLYNALEWRSIGPFRGGRSSAVTGVEGQPNVYYMGSAGGGVWKTTDAGNTWANISDGYFGGSIGAVAVAESDPNVIYAGGGEKTVRGNVSHGYGVWKSYDAGKTWQASGLQASQRISRIRIHPKNPEIAYAAVMGRLFGASDERGVYRTKDGGKSWQRVLFANNHAGAVDLILDPNNPRIMFASTWRILRTPYSLESGGEGSALWYSSDGGDTWKDISKNKGLPKGTWGIVGVTVSPVNSNRVWAIIENQEGGVYRSDDGGTTWAKVNENRNLRQRAWYYSRIFADTQDENMVYVVNVSYGVSRDGGRNFEMKNAPHGDHHDLWISKQNHNFMVIADDGGAQVSLDSGTNFTTYHNQPTAQYYRVVADNSFPYRLYVAQQDNSTLRVRHRSTNYEGITEKDWEITAGGESGHIAVDPKNNDIVYGGSYGGYLTRVDHKTGEERTVDVYPDNPMGDGASAMKYRFQWNFPLFFSPNDPNALYAGGNRLFKSTNEGQSWEMISPDLTRNEPTKMISSGGSITKDNTGVEYYCTIFAACESQYEKDLLWVGSDDGLVHVSKDGGKNWANVTPPKDIMPEWIMINSIDPHPFVKGGAYIAATAYKANDFEPYLYRTLDYGKTWTKITNGINKSHFTRVLRADPVRQGLLYAGTETGMYLSFDDGANWQPFQLNLPIVPITDLTIKDGDLIAATQGRSLWIIDDLAPVRELKPEHKDKKLIVFNPRKTFKIEGGNFGNPKLVGKNPPNGVTLQYYLKSAPDTANVLSIEILDKNQKSIKKYASNAKEKADMIEAKAAGNRFTWNMRYPNAETFEGMILWNRGGLQGAMAVPGTYYAKVKFGKDSTTVPFEIVKDPRLSVSQEDLQAQFDFLMDIRDKLNETHKAIKDIRSVRSQMNAYKQLLEKDKHKEVLDAIKDFDKKMTEVEEKLYQTKNRSGQDPLNYPIRLNDKLSGVAGVASSGNFRPTDQASEVKKDLTGKIDSELSKLKTIFETDLPKVNQLIKNQNIDPLILKKEEKKAQ